MRGQIAGVKTPTAGVSPLQSDLSPLTSSLFPSVVHGLSAVEGCARLKHNLKMTVLSLATAILSRETWGLILVLGLLSGTLREECLLDLGATAAGAADSAPTASPANTLVADPRRRR